MNNEGIKRTAEQRAKTDVRRERYEKWLREGSVKVDDALLKRWVQFYPVMDQWTERSSKSYTAKAGCVCFVEEKRKDGCYEVRFEDGTKVVAPKRHLKVIELNSWNAPYGSRAPSCNGGSWFKMDSGRWKWNGPDGTGGIFPTPGGDWTGELKLPDGVQEKPAVAVADAIVDTSAEDDEQGTREGTNDCGHLQTYDSDDNPICSQCHCCYINTGEGTMCGHCRYEFDMECAHDDHDEGMR
jgi:hypothetical protein